MKTIKLTDDQFETLFEFVDQKVESIVEKSIDYQDSEILEEWEDLFDVHTVLEIQNKNMKINLQRQGQNNQRQSGNYEI